MTKPNRATPGGRNRRILANGRSSGRSTHKVAGLERAPDGPDSPGERRRARQRPRGARRAQGRRRWGRAPDPAGVADGRLPGCQQADSRGAGCVTVPSGLAGQPGGSWSFPVGNHNGGPLLGRRGRRGAPGPRRRDRDGVVLAGAWCAIPLAEVLQNPDCGPQRADSHHLQPAGPEPAAAAGRSQSRGGGTGPGGHAPLAARGTGEGCGDGRGPPACGPHRACHEMLRADRPIRFSPGCGAGPAGPGGLRAVRRRLAAQRPRCHRRHAASAAMRAQPSPRSYPAIGDSPA